MKNLLIMVQCCDPCANRESKRSNKRPMLQESRKKLAKKRKTKKLCTNF